MGAFKILLRARPKGTQLEEDHRKASNRKRVYYLDGEKGEIRRSHPTQSSKPTQGEIADGEPITRIGGFLPLHRNLGATFENFRLRGGVQLQGARTRKAGNQPRGGFRASLYCANAASGIVAPGETAAWPGLLYEVYREKRNRDHSQEPGRSLGRNGEETSEKVKTGLLECRSEGRMIREYGGDCHKNLG